MGRPPKQQVPLTDSTEPQQEVVLTHNAFSIYKDIATGKWHVAIVPFNPNDTSTVGFKRAMNFFNPEIEAACEDKWEAFEHFKKFCGEEFFGDDYKKA